MNKGDETERKLLLATRYVLCLPLPARFPLLSTRYDRDRRTTASLFSSASCCLAKPKTQSRTKPSRISGRTSLEG